MGLKKGGENYLPFHPQSTREVNDDGGDGGDDLNCFDDSQHAHEYPHHGCSIRPLFNSSRKVKGKIVGLPCVCHGKETPR